MQVHATSAQRAVTSRSVAISRRFAKWCNFARGARTIAALVLHCLTTPLKTLRCTLSARASHSSSFLVVTALSRAYAHQASRCRRSARAHLCFSLFRYFHSSTLRLRTRTRHAHTLHFSKNFRCANCPRVACLLSCTLSSCLLRAHTHHSRRNAFSAYLLYEASDLCVCAAS